MANYNENYSGLPRYIHPGHGQCIRRDGTFREGCPLKNVDRRAAWTKEEPTWLRAAPDEYS